MIMSNTAKSKCFTQLLSFLLYIPFYPPPRKFSDNLFPEARLYVMCRVYSSIPFPF